MPILMAVVVAGCSDPLDIPTCPTAEREATGDLAVDILGGWSQMSGTETGDHPLSEFGTTEDMHRVWLFEEGGSGHMWYGAAREDGNYEGNTPFTWRVENGQLVVDDLPPATVQIDSPSRLLVEPVDGRPATEGISWNRCDPEITDEGA